MDIVELDFFYLEIIFSFWLAFILFQILISPGGLLKNHKTEYVFIDFVEFLLYGNCGLIQKKSDRGKNGY